MSLNRIGKLIRFWQSQRQKVVLVTGVFDLLHMEHLRFLQKARNAGDRLIVGIESDVRVQSIKGGVRPVNQHKIRLEQIHALKAVDCAFSLPGKFNSQSDWEHFMGTLMPDVYAVSSNSPYQKNKHAICRQFGIRFKVVHQYNPDISTSLLITKLLNSHIADRQPRYRTIVISGHGRGKNMGFPTQNLKIPPHFPYQFGIYAGHVWLKNKKYQGAFHYGPIPTFNQSKASLEVFLLHRRQDIAQNSITFQLIQYIRPILAFSSENLLIKQICRDVELIKTMNL